MKGPQYTILLAVVLLALAATPGRMHPNGRKTDKKILINAQDQYVYEDDDLLAAEDQDDAPFDADNYNTLYDTRLTQQMPRNMDENGNNTLGSEEEDFVSSKAMARLVLMDRILSALGFGESLPTPPNDTYATMPTPINITYEHCPYKYKRCSSQTFFPSCDKPRNTDPDVWDEHFNLFFNLSDDFDGTLDIINATLRLFKNNVLPLEYPITLLINVSMYTKSLNRRRAKPKTTLVADALVSSDYIGWVNLPVEIMVKRWKKSKNNHGLLVTVSDEDKMTWVAPELFVTMDCSSGLVPLPFEIQTDLEGQRYPALNVRQGSLDDEFPGTTEASTQGQDWIMNINPDILNDATNLNLPTDSLQHGHDLTSGNSHLNLAHIQDIANQNNQIHGNKRNRVNPLLGESGNYLASDDSHLGGSPQERQHLTLNHVHSEVFEPASIDSRELTPPEDIQVPRRQRGESRRGRRRNHHSQRRRNESRMT